jgi:hypothetical protein
MLTSNSVDADIEGGHLGGQIGRQEMKFPFPFSTIIQIRRSAHYHPCIRWQSSLTQQEISQKRKLVSWS